MTTAKLRTAGLYRADLSIPFRYQGDEVGYAAHAKTIVETGWWLTNDRLGAPGRMDMRDIPGSDTLHFAALAVLSWFSSDWAWILNVYFLLGFPLTAATAIWSFRRMGLSPAIAAAMAAIYAYLPYHFARSVEHLFLSGYFMAPPALLLVYQTALGRSFLVPAWPERSGVDTGPAGPPH